MSDSVVVAMWIACDVWRRALCSGEVGFKIWHLWLCPGVANVLIWRGRPCPGVVKVLMLLWRGRPAKVLMLMLWRGRPAKAIVLMLLWGLRHVTHSWPPRSLPLSALYSNHIAEELKGSLVDVPKSMSGTPPPYSLQFPSFTFESDDDWSKMCGRALCSGEVGFKIWHLCYLLVVAWTAILILVYIEWYLKYLCHIIRILYVQVLLESCMFKINVLGVGFHITLYLAGWYDTVWRTHVYLCIRVHYLAGGHI